MKIRSNFPEMKSLALHFILMFLLIFGVDILSAQVQKAYELLSPDQSIQLTVSTGTTLSYSIRVDGKKVMGVSTISMTLDNNRVLGKSPKITAVHRRTIDQLLKPVVWENSNTIVDHFNEMTIEFPDKYSVVFRVYNNGMAYRFQTDLADSITVISEEALFNFSDDSYAYFPQEKSFFSHNECSYLHVSLDSIKAEQLASLPLLVATGGPKILITESALTDYPGMWIRGGSSGLLHGVFPGYPLKAELKSGSDRHMPVTQYAGFIAVTTGKRGFPWRILAVAKSDGDLITNQLTYQLAEEEKIEDTSWIKPGKVAWDWWNFNNIYGVDFRAGINTATYKYYIDFASKYGIEYIILDEGWYKLGNLLDVVPDIDIEEIVAYGKKKNVGIILWVIWKTLDDQLQEALDQFEKWGIAGIKVDFMQRDDQWMVNYYWKIAAEAAKRKLLVDFHGAYKPSGLRRAYPNVITREGVKGLEHNKWSDDITPEHNVTLPFIRMVAGPMDYTPGAMINAHKENFRAIFKRPMSMGTRAHQMAMYVIYESPLQMLADNPSNYLRESECTEFLSRIPTVWEQTRVLAASVGDYVIVARKNGNDWSIGAMSDEETREFTLDFSFLEEGQYFMEMIEDGVNADRYASDYKKVTATISSTDQLKIKLAPGGGWVARLSAEQ